MRLSSRRKKIKQNRNEIYAGRQYKRSTASERKRKEGRMKGSDEVGRGRQCESLRQEIKGNE